MSARDRDKVKPLSFRTVFRHQSSGNATGNCASAPGNAPQPLVLLSPSACAAALFKACPLSFFHTPHRYHAPTIHFAASTLSLICDPLPCSPPHYRCLRRRFAPPLTLQTPHGSEHLPPRCLPLCSFCCRPIPHSCAVFSHARNRPVSQPCRFVPSCPGCFCNNAIPWRSGCHARCNS